MSKVSPQSIIVTNKNDGTLLAVQVLENENAEESIIMLRGGPGYPDSFVEVSEVLNDKFRVISFHQRGTGLSKNPSKDYSIDSYISDIEAISEYFILSRFHIYGHSWGGLYGQLYAEKHSSKVLSLSFFLVLALGQENYGRKWKIVFCNTFRTRLPTGNLCKWASFHSLEQSLVWTGHIANCFTSF